MSEKSEKNLNDEFIKMEKNRKLELLKKFLEEAKEKNKVGRNEPCPCGSGKKYKKCCLNR